MKRIFPALLIAAVFALTGCDDLTQPGDITPHNDPVPAESNPFENGEVEKARDAQGHECGGILGDC